MHEALFFIGHRQPPEKLLRLLAEEIERHISLYGVTEFVVGNHGGFDYMAASAIMAAKKQHPQVTLFLLLPYHPAEHPINVPNGFDGTFYPPMENVPRRVAISCANRYRIDHSDYLIAYTWHPSGNARKFVDYAKKRKIHVSNLADFCI